MTEPRTFLSRVYDVKYRFEKQAGFVATQLFLGPKEFHELNKYVRELERDGLLISVPAERVAADYYGTLSGMTVIGLASDGMRAGISSV